MQKKGSAMGEITVKELKRLLAMFPDDYPVEFQPVMLPDGTQYRLEFYRLKDRGFCHFEWNTLSEEDKV